MSDSKYCMVTIDLYEDDKKRDSMELKLESFVLGGMSVGTNDKGGKDGNVVSYGDSLDVMESFLCLCEKLKGILLRGN